jgi:hypothetical protein
MFDSHRRSLFLAILVALAAGSVAACTEDLGTGAACPELCPDQDISMIDTVIEPIVIDTTLIGIPPAGSIGRLFVAARGDTVVSYGVIRFDSLTRRFRPDVDDTTTVPIADVREASLQLLTDTARRIVTAPITIELYDVDTTAADTSTAAIVALVRPDRLIGSLTLPQDTTLDTLRVPVNDAALMDRIGDAGRRLRIAVTIGSAESAQLYVVGLISDSDAARLSYVPLSDEGAEGARVTVTPRSTTPAESQFAATLLTDYTVIAVGSDAVPGTELAVGGLPNRRTYLRFEIPPSIVDSSSVVRATLLLTQQPTHGIAEDDTIGVFPYIVTAGAPVTDIARAALVSTPGSAVGLDSLKVVPSDSGLVTLDVVRLLRAWRGQNVERVPRALVLRTGLEGLLPVEVRFFSTEAAEELRPRLRLTYIPRTTIGLP